MPPRIRALLTATAVLIAVGAWFGRTYIGLVASPVHFFGLALMICGAIWLFPEVKKDTQGR